MDSAIHRNEMRGEIDHHFFTGSQRKLLLDFRKMAMLRDAVGAHGFVALGEEVFDFCRAARAAHAAHAKDANALRLDELPPHQRDERDKDTGRVAAGTRDE